MHNQEAFLVSKAAAIVVAAGTGSRLGGDVPKQFLTLGGKPVLRWSVETLLSCNKFASVVVVGPPEGVHRTASALPSDPRLQIVAGSPFQGPSRSAMA